jgi:hypothetical protein
MNGDRQTGERWAPTGKREIFHQPFAWVATMEKHEEAAYSMLLFT